MKIEIKSDRFIYIMDDSGLVKDIIGRDVYVNVVLNDSTGIQGVVTNINHKDKNVQIDDTKYRISDILSITRNVADKPDMVNHPDHYISENGLEAIDVIESFTSDLSGYEAVETGNVLKYMLRWKHKNGLEDLKKAQWYLNRLIKNKEKENDNYEKN